MSASHLTRVSASVNSLCIELAKIPVEKMNSFSFGASTRPGENKNAVFSHFQSTLQTTVSKIRDSPTSFLKELEQNMITTFINRFS